MARLITHPLKELHFTGGRFEEYKGWLDFDVLTELQAYKRLLIETAKEEWKRRNPGRERLPKGFEESVRLGFHEIREGSCAVPIERIVEVEDDAMELYVEDDLDEAARIIDGTLVAARDDTPYPEYLPANVIPFFQDWGKTLGPEEAILLKGSGEECLRFDISIRERLSGVRTERYEDTVDIVGEVRAAELRAREEGGSFSIQMEDGGSVPGAFSSEQEARITEALHEHHRVRLRITGQGEFEPGGRLNRILRVDSIEERQAGEVPYDPDAPRIWEVIAQIGESVPVEEWDKVPTDLAENIDHYLYGAPKKG